IRPSLLPLLCECGIPSGGLVVQRLELYRDEHPQRSVEAPVVVPVNPAGSRELDVRERSEWPAVEDYGADALGLESPWQSRGRCPRRLTLSMRACRTRPRRS